MTDRRPFDIGIHHISITGGIGVFPFIVLLVATMVIELPQLRWPVIGGAAAGVVLGAGLILWRARTGPILQARVRVLWP